MQRLKCSEFREDTCLRRKFENSIVSGFLPSCFSCFPSSSIRDSPLREFPRRLREFSRARARARNCQRYISDVVLPPAIFRHRNIRSRAREREIAPLETANFPRMLTSRSWVFHSPFIARLKTLTRVELPKTRSKFDKVGYDIAHFLCVRDNGARSQVKPFAK